MTGTSADNTLEGVRKRKIYQVKSYKFVSVIYQLPSLEMLGRNFLKQILPILILNFRFVKKFKNIIGKLFLLTFSSHKDLKNTIDRFYVL